MKTSFYILLLTLITNYCKAQHNYKTINFKQPELGQMQVIPMNYDLDVSQLRPDSKKFLDSFGNLMTAIDSMQFDIISYTDCRSSELYNRDLSQRRADEIASYLIAKYPSLQIIAIGGGESNPMNDCNCEGESKSKMTRYFEDTIDGTIHPIPVAIYDTIAQQKIIKTLTTHEQMQMTNVYFLPCNEMEHQRNRRTIIRIVGRKPRG